MVKKLAKERNFMFVEHQEFKSPELPRVGMVTGSVNMDQLGKFKSKLRILVGREIVENEVFVSNVKPKKFKQKHLRVLDLSFDTTSDSPVSSKNWLHGMVGSLPNLTCLKIESSALTCLPKSLMHLSNLETLCLFRCRQLKELPSEISHLQKLTVLDFIRDGCST
ncbi:hypothetical protein Sjap_025071 [Stephania japonica]|uniref:R13L1/DRL21-like LRR repeat region domain-containing protein n=1 Tax=Stephania japonica TaxID=461633 RepID=A0AAP0HJ91_9MAGN